jgi:hypothetical protein
MATETHINANVVPRLPSRFEVWDRFSVEIRPNLLVPNLDENQHLQIWQLFEADWFPCFFRVKRCHLHIVSILNTQRPPPPPNILLRVCLLFGLLSLVHFDNWRANGVCYEKGHFTFYISSLQAHLFFRRWTCTRAKERNQQPVKVYCQVWQRTNVNMNQINYLCLYARTAQPKFVFPVALTTVYSWVFSRMLMQLTNQPSSGFPQ